MPVPRPTPLVTLLAPRRLPGARTARRGHRPAPRLRLRGPRLRVRGDRPRDLPRPRHRQPRGRIARRRHRQRGRRAARRVAHLGRGRARRRGRDRGAHRQAGPLRGQHPLPLRPRARQPDLPARRARDRPRGHSRDAHEQRLDGPFVPDDFSGACPRRSPRSRRRIEGIEDEEERSEAEGIAGLHEELPGRAGGHRADRAQHDPVGTHDPLSRRPRDPPALLRARPHRRRRGGAPAERARDHHGRPARPEPARTWGMATSRNGSGPWST